MIKKIRSAVTRTAVGTALVVAAVACSDKFVEVTNPNVIDAATVDPTSGATTLALSAQQNYATALGWLAMYGGWFTEEANVSDTFPTRNEFGFRLISDLNGSLQTDVWAPISIQSSRVDSSMRVKVAGMAQVCPRAARHAPLSPKGGSPRSARRSR